MTEEDRARFDERERELLAAAYDPKLSAKDQQNAFAAAAKHAQEGSPAVDNHDGSRWDTVLHNDLRRAYHRAGLKW
jgi:hypothetical protein